MSLPLYTGRPVAFLPRCASRTGRAAKQFKIFFVGAAHDPEMTSEYDWFGELAAWATVGAAHMASGPLPDAEEGTP